MVGDVHAVNRRIGDKPRFLGLIIRIGEDIIYFSGYIKRSISVECATDLLCQLSDCVTKMLLTLKHSNNRAIGLGVKITGENEFFGEFRYMLHDCGDTENSGTIANVVKVGIYSTEALA